MKNSIKTSLAFCAGLILAGCEYSTSSLNLNPAKEKDSSSAKENGDASVQNAQRLPGTGLFPAPPPRPGGPPPKPAPLPPPRPAPLPSTVPNVSVSNSPGTSPSRAPSTTPSNSPLPNPSPSTSTPISTGNFPGNLVVTVLSPTSISKGAVSIGTHYAQQGVVSHFGTFTSDATCQMTVVGFTFPATENEIRHPNCVLPSVTPSPSVVVPHCVEGTLSQFMMSYNIRVSSPVCTSALGSQTYNIPAAKDTLPSSFITLGVCRNNNTVFYSLPSPVFDNKLFVMNYANRTGTLVATKRGATVGDLVNLTLNNLTLENPSNTADKIQVKVEVQDIKVIGPSDTCTH